MTPTLVAVVVAVPLNPEQFRRPEYRCPEHEMDHDAPPRIGSGRSHNPSVQGSSPCCPTGVSAALDQLGLGQASLNRPEHGPVAHLCHILTGRTSIRRSSVRAGPAPITSAQVKRLKSALIPPGTVLGQGPYGTFVAQRLESAGHCTAPKPLAGPRRDGDLAQDGRRGTGTRSVSSAKEIPNVSRTVTPDLSRRKTAMSV